MDLQFRKTKKAVRPGIVQKDLERAGIPYETHEGLADFHATRRRSRIADLTAEKALIMARKVLARQAEIRQTAMYTNDGKGRESTGNAAPCQT